MSAELAGALGERVTILRRSAARDALGGASGAWVAVAEMWAAIAPDGAGEAVSGDVLSAAMRWRVTVRAPADVTLGDRIAWRGQTLKVRGRMDDPGLPDRAVLATEEVR